MPASLTVTVVVPAHNEEEGLPATLEALLTQTRRPQRIIVADDCSTDRTAEVAARYPVSLSRSDVNRGKAWALSSVLARCETDLLLVVDGDTVLAPDFVERISEAFADPKVAVAAGYVQPKRVHSPSERGRLMEYLFAFHFRMPIQNKTGALIVCPGCCAAYRVAALRSVGGFPPGRTVCEDVDTTWTLELAGWRAVYVSGAAAFVEDPRNVRMLRKQVRRWMADNFQNMRIHRKEIRKRPMLLLWVLLILWDVLNIPLWWASPFLMVFWLGIPPGIALAWWLGIELLTVFPVWIAGAVKRKVGLWRLLASFPFIYLNRVINSWYAVKYLIVELVLVPLHLASSLAVFEKGH